MALTPRSKLIPATAMVQSRNTDNIGTNTRNGPAGAPSGGSNLLKSELAVGFGAVTRHREFGRTTLSNVRATLSNVRNHYVVPLFQMFVPLFQMSETTID